MNARAPGSIMLRIRRFAWAAAILGGCLAAVAANPGSSTLLHFEVTLKPGLVDTAQTGRLFVLLGQPGAAEPRFTLGQSRPYGPLAFARDVSGFSTNAPFVLNQASTGFPVTNLARVPAGEYVVQAFLEVNNDLRTRDAPGNCYSVARRLRVDPASGNRIPLELSRRLPEDKSPAETAQVKYVRVQSEKLSRFHGRPMFLRAGVVLPKGYDQEPARRYPLWVQIGGLNTRYTMAGALMRPGSDFRALWDGADCPRFILLHLDGAGPYGDPYYVNSANNGPYGDALMEELLPEVERRFRARGTGKSRVLSGVSTGAWVSLALQVFHPDDFNGAWASCPDPVDFRALEVLDIYEEKNAYINPHGYERPSVRDPNGDIRLTLRHEIALEQMLGRGEAFVNSGEQWGAWHAAFSPRDEQGLPKPLWDPRTGLIDKSVAAHWKQYDLRHYLETHWSRLGPKLKGKLHIAAGESDEYFLANAIRLLDAFLAGANPPADAHFAYGPGQPHGWRDISDREMLAQMAAAVGD